MYSYTTFIQVVKRTITFPVLTAIDSALGLRRENLLGEDRVGQRGQDGIDMKRVMLEGGQGRGGRGRAGQGRAGQGRAGVGLA